MLWQAGTKSMQVKRGETTLVLTVGQPKITVNGAEKDLSTAPILKGSTLFAPVADVLQALGLKADWRPTPRSCASALPRCRRDGRPPLSPQASSASEVVPVPHHRSRTAERRAG